MKKLIISTLLVVSLLVIGFSAMAQEATPTPNAGGSAFYLTILQVQSQKPTIEQTRQLLIEKITQLIAMLQAEVNAMQLAGR